MTHPTTSLYKIQHIRILEKLAEDYGISESMLMQRAALAAFNILRAHWSQAKRILIYCGRGNNAGDGFILAQIAHKQGLDVIVRYIGEIESLRGTALEQAKICGELGINCQAFSKNETISADLIVDALLGIGIQGEVSAEFALAITAINQSNKPVLALDVPSGIEADTGSVLGCAVKAMLTLNFLALKQGLFTGQAKTYTGENLLETLGLPESAYQKLEASAKLLTDNDIKSNLLPRSRHAHKGHFGHVLVIGGNKGMAGAVRMSAEASARIGAGLVSIATRPEHAALISLVRPELMCHPTESANDIMNLLKRATVIVIGPGLGQDNWAQDLFNIIIKAPQPKICDADALNLLALNPIKLSNWILTPHPGEAARLLNTAVAHIESDRFAAVQNIISRYGGACVLKGAGTLVATEHEKINICTAGNPGMATGGMGDILSGIIGGLVAQGMHLFSAAKLGVQIHARAADKIAALNGERGMLATDLFSVLPQLINPH